MCGQIAMKFAVKNPMIVYKLIIVDIIQKYYVFRHDRLIEGMKAIPLDEITTRSEAEVVLSGYEPEVAVRQFLLKNLTRNDDGKFTWRPNLHAIDEHLDEIGEGMVYQGSFNGESLFVNGNKSNYFADGDQELIKKIFLKAKFVSLNTGHWVQAEKPQEFAQTVLQFLNGK